jgi:predicted RNA-binding Zn-ribbon protein involved in translation (DUF1610 family)
MKKCRYCNKPFEEHSASNQNDHNLWIEEDENKMKCPKCGNEMYKMQSKKDCYVCEACGESPIVRQQNPSPRDIFQHIKTDCELRGFQKFLFAYSGTVPDRPLENETIKEIKENRPDWYSWLQHKGLVHKEKVKREAWVNVYAQMSNGKVVFYYTGRTFDSKDDAQGNHEKDGTYLKTILLHEWEEEK